MLTLDMFGNEPQQHIVLLKVPSTSRRNMTIFLRDTWGNARKSAPNFGYLKYQSFRKVSDFYCVEG